MAVKQLRAKKSQRGLARLALFLYRRYPWVLAVFAALTVLFAAFASKLEQKTSVRDLLPSENAVVQRFERTVRDFDLIDRVVVALEFEPQELDAAEAFAEILVDVVAEHPDTGRYLRWLRANLFDEAEGGDWSQYLRFLPRLAPPDQVGTLADRLSAAGVAARVRQNRRELETGVAAKLLVENDPLNLLAFAGGYRQEIAGNYQIRVADGFLVSKDRRMLLLLGKPIHSPEDVDFALELNDFLAARLDEAGRVFAEEEGQAAAELLKIGLTGPHIVAAQENRLIRGDALNMFVTSFVAVMLLFVLAYRRPRALWYIGAPLLCAEIWTLGAGYLMFGRLNLMTAAFSAIIVGLGVDYAIHIFSRYLDERRAGGSPLAAMRLALSETGMGVIVGGMTTAFAFLAMGLTRFTGLREFAIAAGVGIVICLTLMLAFMPCLIFLSESRRGRRKPIARPQWDFRLGGLIRLALRRKFALLSVIWIGTLFLAYHAFQLRFTADLRNVRARANPAIALQSRVTEKVGGSLRSLAFVLEAGSEQTLYRMHQQMLDQLARLERRGEVARYDSLLSMWQGQEAQRRNLGLLARAGLSGAGLIDAFETAMNRADMVVTPASRAYIENLAAGVDAREPVSLRQIYAADPDFTRAFLHIDGDRFKTVVHVYPASGLWERRQTRRLAETLIQSVEPGPDRGVFATGVHAITLELQRMTRVGFRTAAMLSVGLVLVVLFLHFRRWPLVLLTLTPLVASVIWMLGAMRLLGVDITVLNFVATPIIIGIGIDDGVHIVEKFLHRGSGDIVASLASCGKAVTLTSLTTILSFSSLFTAEYAGFRGLGFCAILGVFFCWLSSVFVLPLLLAAFNVQFIRQQGE